MDSQPGASTTTRLAYTGTASEEVFRFHPRTTNPELWRTTMPLVVYERCAGHKGMIASWMAIHWLIILHAASGRRAFGMREIAARAHVGRNELAGSCGYIQRLVDLDLLRIVGYERIPGLSEPRPIYHIDLWELEQQSIALVPEMLRAYGVMAPPRPAPDPRQNSFFDTLEPSSISGTELARMTEPNTSVRPEIRTGLTLVTGSETRQSEIRTELALTPEPGTRDQPEIRTELTLTTRANTRDQPENGTEHVTRNTCHPENGTESPNNELETPWITSQVPENGTDLPEIRTGQLVNGVDLSQNRDVDRKKEGEKEKEREREIAPTRDTISQIAAQAAQTVITLLRQQGAIPSQPSAPLFQEVPATPTNHPPLPAAPLVLWQGDRSTLPARERHQLTMLTNEVDISTSGFGAYWVGRAILIADRCLGERNQPLSLNYLRSMLRRWTREDSWGSDLESDREAPSAPPSRPVTGTAETRPSAPPSEVPDSPPDPAVARYSATFGHQPNQIQMQQITSTVRDLAVWERVLTDWQAHNWRSDSVPKMLDRYRTLAAASGDSSTKARVPNLLEIYQHPNIEDTERQRWLYCFTHAGPAERVAIMAKFREEYGS